MKVALTIIFQGCRRLTQGTVTPTDVAIDKAFVCLFELVLLTRGEIEMSMRLKSHVLTRDPGVATVPLPSVRLLAWTLFAGILVAVATVAVAVAPAPAVDTAMNLIGP